MRPPKVLTKQEAPAPQAPAPPGLPHQVSEPPPSYRPEPPPPMARPEPIQTTELPPAPDLPPYEPPEDPAPAAVPDSRPIGGFSWHRPLTFSFASVCIAAAVAIVALIVVSATAYRAGYAQADDQATRELRATTAPLTDPLRPETAQQQAAAPQPLTHAPRSAEPPRTAAAPRQPAAQPQPVIQPTPQPFQTGARAVIVPPEADPRQEGLNYYAIVGQLDRDSAERIAGFLAENGLDALAVETRSRGSNNPRYRVLGLLGLSSEELRTPAKTQYEQQISQLGQIWRRDHRGWTDFSDAYWERYRP